MHPGKIGNRGLAGRKVASAFLVALLTFILFLPALRNDFVNWDDDLYVYENPAIQQLNGEFLKWSFGLHALNWHPLTWISHALDYAVWGSNPLGHHLSSLLFHAANTFLFCLLAIKLIVAAGPRVTRSPADPALMQKAVLSAAAGALLFGIHPLHVESVAWVSERKDVLSAFFSLLSLLSYCRYADSHSPEGRAASYISSLAFFMLALLAKPMAVTLPVVMLILDLYPFRRLDHGGTAGSFKKIVTEKVPFFFFSIAAALLTIIAQHSGGAMVSLKAFPLWERIVIAFSGFWFYLSKMILPVDLSPYYPIPQNISFLSFKYLVPSVLTILASAFCVKAWKKGHKVYAAVWVYYIITLLPVIGIIQTGEQAVADRYFYLPGTGFFLLAGLGVSLIWEKFFLKVSVPLFRKALVMFSLILVLLSLSLTTTRQIIVWSDSMTLWDHELKNYPDNWLALINRARAYMELGEFQKSLEDINKSIARNPGYAKAYYIRAVNYTVLGRYEEALKDLDSVSARDASFAKAPVLRSEILRKIKSGQKSTEASNKQDP